MIRRGCLDGLPWVGMGGGSWFLLILPVFFFPGGDHFLFCFLAFFFVSMETPERAAISWSVSCSYCHPLHGSSPGIPSPHELGSWFIECCLRQLSPVQVLQPLGMLSLRAARPRNAE